MKPEEEILNYKTIVFKEFVNCCQLLNTDEQIHFTTTLQKILPLIYRNENDPQILDLIEQELYKTYRHKMRYFHQSCFINLFFRSSDQMQSIFKNNPASATLYDELFIELYSFLEEVKTFLYLAEPNSTGLSKIGSENEKLLSSSLSVVKRKIFDTRPQQVLLMYYLTKGLGIKTKVDIPVTKIAMFYHALLGWEYTDINNTAMYKLLKKAPYIQSNKKLFLRDLLWVKTQIEPLGITSLIELIDKELKEIEKQIE